jgi:hypothetical protein
MEAAIADTVAGVGKAKNIYTKEDNPKKTLRLKSDLLTGIFIGTKLHPFPLHCTVYVPGTGR